MRLARSLAERFSRRVVLLRRLPRRYGGESIYVSPDASLRYWLPGLARVDPALLETATQLVRPGDIVWDIGANVGLFAFASAGLAGPKGRVLAVEPDYWLVGLLQRSARRISPRAAPVSVLCAALGSRAAIARMNINQRGRASNYVSVAQGTKSHRARELYDIATTTLDTLLACYGAPTIVKIDVEGLESEVLSAGTELLSRAHPCLICEVRDEAAQPITARLHGAGYILYDMERRPEERRPLTRAVWNTIAIHQSSDSDRHSSVATHERNS